MPLTPKGNKILNQMKKTYPAKQAKKVFYASINKGTVAGAESGKAPIAPRSRRPIFGT